jgi:CysZ protein
MAVKQSISGFGHLIKGLGLIWKPGLRRFVALPFLVNLLVFSGLVWLGIDQFEGFMNSMLPQEGFLSYLRWLLWPVFALAAVLIVFYTFTTIANLIAAPFNSLLAEKVEVHLSGRKPKESGPLWKEIAPTIASELRKILYFLIRAVPLLLLFLIPGLNLIAPVLWIMFSAWFLALEYGDYPMANHQLKFADQHRRLKQQRLASMAFGGGVMLLMMIPVINFIAMPAAVAGATSMWVAMLKQES